MARLQSRSSSPTTRMAVAAGIGAAAGMVGGLFGVGGGIIMVPGLVLLLGLEQPRAHATSVTAIVPASAAAAAPLALDHLVHWTAAALLLAGAVIGAFLGARLMAKISEEWLAWGFVLLLVIAAARMALNAAGTETAAISEVHLGAAGAGLALVGLSAGLLASLLGIGGGLIFVPALVALYAFPQHVAQATSLIVIVPTTLVAAIAHAVRGRVDWQAVGGLGLGGLVGGLAGGVLALNLEGGLLSRLFAALLVVTAIRMLRITAAASRDASAP